MHAFRLASGAVAYANTTAPTLPPAIAGYVQSVVGLDNLSQSAPAAPAGRGATSLAPTDSSRVVSYATTGASRPCSAATKISGSPRTANQVAQAYDFGPLYSAGDFGGGETIAFMELSAYLATDVSTYQTCYGTHVPVTVKSVAGGNSGWSVEADMDIEDVIGLDPGLKSVLVYEAPSGNHNLYALDDYTAIQVDDAAQVVSTSWPECEAKASGTAVPESTVFKAMAAQGQSVLVASGDAGDAACGTQLSVEDPTSGPYVTGVGGTNLTALGNPPVFPPSETAWTSSGGGISSLWPMATWQKGKGVVNSYSSGAPCGLTTGYCREVPDVSALAGTPGYAIYAGGSWGSQGGTSLAAPTWAALIALIDASSASCQTNPVGFLDPALYKLATSAPWDFNDITTGNNDLFGIHGGAYPATAGYDMATGLGAPAGANLAHSLCGISSLWAPQANQPNNYLTLSPAAVLAGHTMYTASINATPVGSPGQIDFSRWTTAGGKFLSPVSYKGVNAQSAFAPSITLSGSTPVVAWTDYKTSTVEVSTYASGTWSAPSLVAGGRALTDDAPSISAAGGAFYVTWKAKASQRVYLSVWNGSSWSTPLLVPGAATSVHPAVTWYSPLSSVVVAWTTSTGAMQYDVYSVLGFGGPNPIPGLAGGAPALTVSGKSLYAAWKGTGSSHQIWYSGDSPGQLATGTWTPEKTVPQAVTPYPPAISASGPTLLVAWTGNKASATSDDLLWYSSSDAP